MNAHGGDRHAQMRENAPNRRFIYFLRPVGERGPVKIGCSVHPRGRLMGFTVWSPVPLEIAATIEGGFDLEARFHTLFMEDHSHSEWFRGSDRMDAVIGAICAGTFDVASLPRRRPGTASLSDIGRQNRGLRVRLSHRFADKCGRMPEHVQAAYDALSLPCGPERDRAVELVRSLLAEAT